jgi:hypothetical protein
MPKSRMEEVIRRTALTFDEFPKDVKKDRTELHPPFYVDFRFIGQLTYCNFKKKRP